MSRRVVCLISLFVVAISPTSAQARKAAPPAGSASATTASSWPPACKKIAPALESSIESQRQRRDPDVLILELERVLPTAGRCTPVYQLLGSLYERGGRFGNAQRVYQRALKADPHSNQALDMQLNVDAMQALEQAKEEAPERYRRLHYERLLTWLHLAIQQNRPEEIIALADSASRVAGERFEAPALAGTALAALGMFSLGCPYLQRAAQLSPLDKEGGLSAAAAACAREARYQRLVQDGLEALDSEHEADAADKLLSAWQMYPERRDLAPVVITALLAVKRFDEATKMLGRLRKHGSPLQRKEVEDLEQRLVALRAATADSERKLPAVEREALDPNYEELAGQMRAALRRADDESERALREAKENEARIAQLEAELPQEEASAAHYEQMAAQAERDADALMQNTSGTSSVAAAIIGGIGAAAGKTASIVMRQKASNARARVESIKAEIRRLQGPRN